MKTVTFHYVRHGQTLFNRLGRMQGWCDSPLTEKGLEDAAKARDILKDVPLTKACISTSERCRDTCAVILEGRDVPVYEMKGLKEVNFGEFEGVEMSTHMDEIGPRRAAFHWRDAGGEDREDFEVRLKKTYREIYDASADGDDVLIVSHGAAFIWMMPILFGMDQKQYFDLKRAKGLVENPNGYIGRFTCTDGMWKFVHSPGLSEEELDHCIVRE